ncbi:MAG: hypothetical protein ACFFBV_14430 [Promethearchaeota archaeon]
MPGTRSEVLEAGGYFQYLLSPVWEQDRIFQGRRKAKVQVLWFPGHQSKN